jgi:tRNA U34 5-carboxymethylaminomethyl modifying GTPase MnmE/TrmE
VLEISANDAESTRSQLCRVVEGLFTDEKLLTGQDAIVSSARVHAMLIAACEHIDTALEGVAYGLTSDLVASDIERALRVISEADGREVSEALTNDIFSKFCVGK